MSEPTSPQPLAGIAVPAVATGHERSAGTMLRDARQAQGLHIAALAASIKVSPKKLEALEADRYDELLDTTFIRALAQAVCRALKIDSVPILARLPQQPSQGLEQVAGGLNTSYRERGSRRDMNDWPRLNRPAVWGTLVLVIAAGIVYFLPPGWFGQHFGSKAALQATAASAALSASSVASETPAASSASEPVDASASGAEVAAPSVPVVPATPAVDPAAILNGAPVPDTRSSSVAAHAQATPASGTELSMQTTTGPSWLDVQDATGKTLISRTVEAGESVSLAGAPPLKVKIGNATVVQMRYRGEPVALPPKATIVKLELK